VLVELRKPFTNYGPNKRRNCNWVVSHLRITKFYAKQTALICNMCDITYDTYAKQYMHGIIQLKMQLYSFR